MKLPSHDEHFVIMCDAGEHAASYVLVIEEYSGTSAKQTYAHVSFESKTFRGGQTSLIMYANEFLAINFAFDENGHI